MSAAMDPYVADRQELLIELGRVVGDSRLTVYFFQGKPATSKRLHADRTVDWKPPPRGTPVVAISDFGMGGPRLDPSRASSLDWARFAALCKRAGCPLVGFTPFGPRRWPAAIRKVLVLVHWDRRTTASAVHQSIGPGHSFR
jgi:hypothetical protein